MKNNLKYILLLACGFLWCSLAYLSQELFLLKSFSTVVTNNVIMVYDSLAMAFGIILFMILFKKRFNVKKIYLFFLLISFGLNILFYMLDVSKISMVISIIMCIVGSAGFGVAYHFSLVSTNIKKEDIGIVFACGYGTGALLTYFISLIPNNFINSPNILIVTIPLILFNTYFIYKNKELTKIETEEKLAPLETKKLLVLISLVLVMSLISSFSSNMIAIFNYTKETGFAYSRVYYAVGLLLAGYLVNKNKLLFDILTIASLLFPLIAIIIFREQSNIVTIAKLNYFFISFFVIYRTLSFMNLSKNSKVYLSAFGLCICRIIEGLLSLTNTYSEFSYLFLVISIIVLIALMLALYIYLYSLNFVAKEDVIQDFCVKYKLSIQEKKILTLILQDYTNDDMASTLVLSINTVRNHVAHIYKKCGMKKHKIKEIILKKTI